MQVTLRETKREKEREAIPVNVQLIQYENGSIGPCL